MFVVLYVCYSSVSSNIIFMGFDLVDKVKSVVKYLILVVFTHQSCAQHDRMLVASWSRMLVVVAYSSVLHRSLMNTKKCVGDMTPPCGTPCLRSISLLVVLSMTTLARRLCRYDLIHLYLMLSVDRSIQ